jgi:Family of unknown function (DUF6519)
MASDRARASFDPSRKWRGLVAQQGRVTVEADWNEAAAIQTLSDRLTALDIIGPLGTPDGGYAVASGLSGSPPTGAPGPLTVGAGTVYVGGVRLDLDQEVELDGTPQPDWLDQSTNTLWVAPEPAGSSPPSSPPGSTNELVYLLAVEQEVSALEVPELADVALGGPDTMQRLRILQRFVRWPTQTADCSQAWAEVQAAWNTIGLDFDSATMLLGSAARLEVSFDPVPPSAGPCEPAATGGYLGPENQMIRVQVASVDPSTGVPTIVWGFDDATFLYELQSAVPGSSGMVLTLTQNPVDSYHYPQAGQAVELLRDAAALSPTDDGNGPFDYIASESGFVTTVTSAYNPSLMNLTVADQPPADYLSTSATQQLYLRVWQGTAEAPAGTAVELEAAGATTGIQVTLTSNEGFHPGDFWCFAVRPSVANLVYPARVAASPQPPDGPRVWACPVAFVAWADSGPPAITSCIPPFDNLVELTGNGGGCCTLSVSPADLDGDTSLNELIAAHQGSGVLRVCFAPGTYTLPEPLILGPEYSGIALEGCRPGVVLQAAADPGIDFVLGLIVIEGAQQVSITGIDIKLPSVVFPTDQESFAALGEADTTNANRAILEAFTNAVEVAIGISAANAANLRIEDCTFEVQSDGTDMSLFSAAVLAGGQMTGLQLTGCTFSGLSPDTVAFYDLAAGQAAAGIYQLTFGYLQVASNQTKLQSVLHDATIRDCLFEGITVPALAMDRLGDLRLRDNTIRDCYGGFWLYSLAESAGARTFDVLPVGNADLRSNLETLGVTALDDAIPLIASAMVRVLPASPPTDAASAARVIAAADQETLANLASGMKAFFNQITASLDTAAQDPVVQDPVDQGPVGHGPVVQGLGGQGPSSPPSSASSPPSSASSPPSSAGVPVQGETTVVPVLDNLLNSLGTAGPPVPIATDTGVTVALRLDMSGCQVDSVLVDSYSGAALIVADLSAAPGSALIHGNRLRNRFPSGQTALVVGMGDVAITGNVMANEVPKSAGGTTYSLVLLEGATTNLPTAPVAVVGNVFVDLLLVSPMVLPWGTLNTVTLYL